MGTTSRWASSTTGSSPGSEPRHSYSSPYPFHFLKAERGVELGKRLTQVPVQPLELAGVELRRVLVLHGLEAHGPGEVLGKHGRIERLPGHRRHLRLTGGEGEATLEGDTGERDHHQQDNQQDTLHVHRRGGKSDNDDLEEGGRQEGAPAASGFPKPCGGVFREAVSPSAPCCLIRLRRRSDHEGRSTRRFPCEPAAAAQTLLPTSWRILHHRHRL